MTVNASPTAALSPQAETILLLMAGLEDIGNRSIHTDDISWSLGSQHGSPEKPAAKLPGRAPTSWFFRHRKRLSELGLAHFSRNGYGQHLSTRGRELAVLLRGETPDFTPSRWGNGAALLDWRPAPDRRVYANGLVIQRTRLCWLPIAWGISSRVAVGSDRQLADGSAPRPGMKLALCNRADPFRRDNALTRAPLGTLVRAVGPWAWLDTGNPLDLAAYPVCDLIEAGRADVTGLSSHQKRILDRLLGGTAEILVKPDGGLTVKSTPNAREGNVHCQPQSFNALQRSGAIAHLMQDAQ